LPPSKTKTSVRKKAHTNFMNRLIKGLVGLNHTWDEIADITGGEITKEKVQNVDYKKSDYTRGNNNTNSSSPTTHKDSRGKTLNFDQLRANLKYMTNSMFVGDIQAIQDYLVEITSFVGKNGDKVKGKNHVDKMTDGQIKFIYSRVEVEYFKRRKQEIEAQQTQQEIKNEYDNKMNDPKQ